MSIGGRRREKPFIVRLFDKYVHSYSSSQGVIFVEPKGSTLIKSLAFRPTSVGVFGFGETKWYVTAVYEAVGRTQMDEEAAQLYRNFKGTECQLEVKGVLRKKITFKPHEKLTRLKRHIPTLQVSDRLCKLLEKEEKVVDLIKSIKPGEMSVGLHSIPELYQVPDESAPEYSASTDPVTQKTVYYFHNPTSITWVTTLSTLFHPGPRVKKKADAVICLFNQVFQIIRSEFNARSEPYSRHSR